jgi:hypothetical protein
MIAADKFDAAVGDVLMRILRRDFVVVVHIQAVFCPGAGIVDDMQKRQVAIRAIGKVNFVHGAPSSLAFSLVEAFGVVNLFCKSASVEKRTQRGDAQYAEERVFDQESLRARRTRR